MRLKPVLLFIICCLCFVRQYAQSNQYLFSHIDVSNGLSNNHVNSIYKDSRGFMWFGTISGLNRYDGYKFKIFRHHIEDTTSLSDNYIDKIFEDFNGKLWVETRAGFNIFDPVKLKIDRNTSAYLKQYKLPETGLSGIVKTASNCWFLYPLQGIFKHMEDGSIVAIKHILNDPNSIDTSRITDIKPDGQGNVWIIHANALLEKIDGIENKVVYRKQLYEHKPVADFSLSKIYIDAQDDLWVYSEGGFKGVYYHKPGSDVVQNFSTESAEGKLSSNLVFGIVQDEKGLVWISTDHGGINVLDKHNFSVPSIMIKDDDPRSIAENSVGPSYKDNLGIIWLGTFKKGIDCYQPNAIRFPLYNHKPSNPSSLPYDDINSFVADKQGNIWIGSNGGGLIYFNRKENRYSRLVHNAGNANSIASDIIVSMCLDKENKLWIGTYFGGLDCYDGKTFTHYKHNDNAPNSLPDDRVMSLYADSNDDIWVGTLSKGLCRFDKSTSSFIGFVEGEPNSIPNNYIASITEDSQKNLWVGTAYGIGVMERSTGKFRRYLNDNSKLSNNNIVCIYKDKQDNIWVGTREGLNILNPDKNTFQSFRVEDGLADNTIRSIKEDNQHNIWISTSNGISKITLKGNSENGYTISCKNYDELDGLQSKEYNNNSACALPSGELVFGGTRGFNLFDPFSIKSNPLAPSIVFTDFQVFNKSLNVDEEIGRHIILNKSITEIQEIKLKYNENVFSIEFASLSFTNTIKNKYAYKLEGFNKDWQYADGRLRSATYTNLDPGTYTFRVKASNEDGVWNEKGIAVKIIVLPPFWRTDFAYLLYALLAAAILYFARRIIIQRAKLRFALEQERKETQRMHELDMMKVRFFTNMSHELRTPISLILAPVDKLLKEAGTAEKRHYELIKKNARRLLNLVNQLLDFRKLETNELKLQTSEADLAKFVKEISLSFTDLAENKNIGFSFESDIESFFTSFDKDKIERILFNLLSNAFKFTPENGKVSVALQKKLSKNADEYLIEIKVKDSGIGIEQDKQEKIFERFFQNDIPNTVLNQGSGIGLAITKEFVKMQQGSIAVESEPDAGSCFTVSLPFKEIVARVTDEQIIAANEELVITSETKLDQEDEIVPVKPVANNEAIKKPVILVVEDNDDFRFYLKDNLKAYFTIIEAVNGKEGWQKALALHPDLVVSDINMPIMDGIELCKKIKSDERTTQISVVLLTAFAGEDQQLKGLGIGAADYMTKPFNFEILLSKIRNLLSYQATIKKTYQKQVQASPSDIETATPDDDFIKKVLASIEENIDNPDFSVEELSQKLFISRGSLYKKLFSLTGKSPIEFIRHIRLQRAAMLLAKSQMTVAEIAYKVGFNNPKYFARYFKAEFGVIPTAYRLSAGNKNVMDTDTEDEQTEDG